MTSPFLGQVEGLAFAWDLANARWDKVRISGGEGVLLAGMPGIPRYVSGQAVTAAAPGESADVTLAVPVGRLWRWGLVAVSVNAGANEVRFLADGAEYWEMLANVTAERSIDLGTRFPEPCSARTSVVFRVTTSDGAAKTLTAKLWYLEV